MLCRLCYLLLATGLCPAHSFAVISPQTSERQLKKSNVLQKTIAETLLSVTGSSRLNYRETDEEPSIYNYNDGTTVFQKEQREIEFSQNVNADDILTENIYLPRNLQEIAQKEKDEKLMNTEMLIGRIAMVATVLLLGNEIIEGKSIPEQINSVLQFIS